MKKSILFILIAILIGVIAMNNRKVEKEIISALATENASFLSYSLGSDWKIIEAKKIGAKIDYYIISYTDSHNEERTITLYKDKLFGYSISEGISTIVTNELKEGVLKNYLDKNNNEVINKCKNSKLTLRVSNSKGNLNEANLLDIKKGIQLRTLTLNKLMKFDSKNYVLFDISYPVESNNEDCRKAIDNAVSSIVEQYPTVNMLVVEKQLTGADGFAKSTCYIAGQKIISTDNSRLTSVCEEEINRRYE